MDFFSYHWSTDDTLSPAFEKHFGRPRRDPKLQDQSLDPYYCDMAASIQRATEIILLRMVNHLHEISGGMKSLCLAGGVALNSVANYKILRDGPFDDVYIHPAPGDDGGSVGAAYWAYNQILDQPRGPALEDAFLGSEHSDADVEAFLKDNDIAFEKIDDDGEFFRMVAQELANGQVCGWFRGRFEWGPRALGSRANEFFEFPEAERHYPARFMLYVAPVREEKRSVLPAITHEDGSGRLQTVYKKTNAAYHAIIEEFGKLTDVPVIMNTSFNLKGEPIVESPAHAFNTFSLSGMDLLFLNNYIVRADAKKQIAETRFHLRHEGDSVTQMVS
jgi:carbamoyltransferase